VTPGGSRTLAAALATVLTASALGPLFRSGDGDWVLPALLAVVLAAGCGALGRAPRVPGAAAALLTPLGLIGLLTAVGSPGDAWLGVIPTGATFGSLRDLVQGGFDDIQTYAPPVPATPGLVLLTTAGVFVVAALVDLLAVTASRAVLAGVPLLALFTVPAAVRPGGVGLLHFVLAAAGWVLLLAMDGRDQLSRWGRVLGRQSRQREPALLGGAAGGVALLSVTAALVVPLALPSLSPGLFSRGGGCCGGGSVSVAPPIVTVGARLHDPQERSLFTVVTKTPQYYRFAPLDAFDGNSFTLLPGDAEGKRVDGPLDRPTPGLGPQVATTAVDAEVRVGQLQEVYLPLPYSPTSVTIPRGSWQLAPALRTVFSTRDTTRDLSFSVHSEVPQPTAEQLRAAGPGFRPADASKALRQQLLVDLVLPPTVPAILGTTADRVTAEKRTGYDKMLALQTFFTNPAVGGFSYDLTPSLPSGAAGITRFLTDKRGYCEQFASSFALMARHLGLPSRVAVGFTPGTEQADGTWQVTNRDAHAWPEVWFDGVGWVRFEPTPRGDVSPAAMPGYLSGAAAGAPAPAPAGPVAAPTPTPSSAAGGRDPDKLDGDQAKPVAPLAGAGSRGGLVPSGGVLVALGAVLLVLTLSASPALVRLALRRQRRRAVLAAGGGRGVPPLLAAAAAWAEVLDTAADLGLPTEPSDTPRAAGRRIRALVSGAAGSPAASRRGQQRQQAEVLAEDSPLGRGGVWWRRLGLAGRLGAGPADPPDPVAALDRVTRAEERGRYAPAGSLGSGDVLGLASDVVVLRHALLSGRSRGARLRATLLPASVLGRTARRLGGAADTWSAFVARCAERTAIFARRLRPHPRS